LWILTPLFFKINVLLFSIKETRQNDRLNLMWISTDRLICVITIMYIQRKISEENENSEIKNLIFSKMFKHRNRRVDTCFSYNLFVTYKQCLVIL
jgi:hypothetical protein